MPEIIVIDQIGPCYGVNLAYQSLLDLLQKKANCHFYLCGQFIHNEIVNNKLAQFNVTIWPTSTSYLNHLKQLANTASAKKAVIVFSAHGSNQRDLAFAKANFQNVYELTCPLVKRNFETIKQSLKSNYQVICYGKLNHPETNAIASLSQDIIICQNINDIEDLSKIANKKIFLTSQSTLPSDDFERFYQSLSKYCLNITIDKQAICQVTSNRQKQLIKQIKNLDCLIVISDLKSNNGMQLAEIAKKANLPTFVINQVSQLDHIDLNPYQTIGLASATSALQEQVKAITKRLISL